ncbi:hypothetical protein C8034_v003170 [Colletotrichum sidae]|uniref:Uncharacterized protein n=1 Tax=Colletotrichum sidae TaxID=1347389 RepID=A0A4V3HZX1_9PEZI|nr:hypothetical protein C8034_v003170 [Colletotrichum sidae]
MASMTAVGLAGLSNLTQHPAMMDWARRSYGTALALTNQALRDPSEAVKDTTMLSILVLGTYEMLTGKNAQTVRAWQEHINGAAALASMRGLGQFGTKAGARMFMMLTQIVLISCIQRNMPMPPPLVELRNQLGMLTGGRDPNWRLTGPIYRVMQLRHDIKCGNLRGTQNVIRELLMVDQEFVDIVADLPDFWHHRLVTLSNPHPAVFDGYHCHVFPSLGLAATWNGVRSLRMLVHETVMGEIFKSLGQQDILCWPEDAKVQLTQSLALLYQLRDAILASVPQHFGVVSFKDGPPESRGQSADTHTGKRPLARFGLSASSSSTSTSASPDASPNRPPPKVASFTGPTLHDPAEAEGISDGAERFMTLASASNTIVWPLYLLGVSSSCTKDVREYVTERLEAIHEETSLVQARIVAHMVQRKRLSIPWSDLPWDQMPQLQNTAVPVLV